MDPSRRVRKKRAYHHGDLRRSLLNAALRLVEERGEAALSLREVARMAGVSHQAPYRHFADRTALVAAVAEEGFRELHAELVEKTGAAPDPLSALRAAGVTYVLFAVAHRAHFRVMFGADAAAARATSPSLDAACEAVFGTLTQAIARLQSVAPDIGDPFALALSAWSLVHGLASLLVEGQLESRLPQVPKDLTELITTVLQHGLALHTKVPTTK
jgi:AcrR family transcriptional regulator